MGLDMRWAKSSKR